MEGERLNINKTFVERSSSDESLSSLASPKSQKKPKEENRKKRNKPKTKKVPTGLSLEEHQMR